MQSSFFYKEADIVKKTIILIILVASMAISGCNLIKESPDPDGDWEPWGIPIPWKNHGPVADWTECVNKYEKTCNQICDQRGKECDERCATESGLPNQGAQAWLNAEGCRGGSHNDGQASCSHVGDLQGQEPRWKCCCK